MTPIEAAARAMAARDGANWDAADNLRTPSGEDPQDMRDGYIDAATVAITAFLDAAAGDGQTAYLAGKAALDRFEQWGPSNPVGPRRPMGEAAILAIKGAVNG